MKKLIFFFALLGFIGASAQPTLINPSKLLKPGANSTFLLTNGSGAVVWANAASLLTGGTGISISGNTITNTAPDQTVSLTGGSGLTVTGTYPSFTLTPADGSATNELQTISAGDGTGSDKTITLSNSGGTITLVQGAGMNFSRSGNSITIASAAVSISTQRYEEVPSSNTTTITVSGFTPTATTTLVFLDGVLMDWGVGEDITASGSVITFASAVLANEKVLVLKLIAS